MRGQQVLQAYSPSNSFCRGVRRIEVFRDAVNSHCIGGLARSSALMDCNELGLWNAVPGDNDFLSGGGPIHQS